MTNKIDDFTQAYIEALFFTLDSEIAKHNIANETLARIKRDCEKFQKLAGDIITYNESQAGHDFWLTRNHHGAGFWDGDWGKPSENILMEICNQFNENTCYLGDDNLIYFYEIE
jgi:hypothetical protein